MPSLSVVISAYNEEQIIEKCLASVTWADEIIFIDNSSTDRTAEIARRYTKKLYTRKNNPMLNINKNFGFTKASGEWILYLDADEHVESHLQREIQTTLNNSKADVQGYRIPRKNIIFGKWIKHTGWYPDLQLRLFRRGAGKFAEAHVHEQVSIPGTVGTLSSPLYHENYRTISQFIKKLDLYTDNETNVRLHDGYTLSTADLFYWTKDEFISRYFARQGYKDGVHGLVLSFLMSFYYAVVWAKLWERNKYIEQDISIDETVSHMQAYAKGGVYWRRRVRDEQSTNLFKKLLIKVIH